jgi:type VI secretion system protein ImpB
MPRESIQKKISRVRPPRVHITYDVETGGAIEKKEIPFVAGVLADLSGQSDKPPIPIKERKFIEIDRDNFDNVMARMAPRVAFKVENRLTNDDTQLMVDLRFSSITDFEPQNIARQVEPLRRLLELRRKLANLRSSLYGNDKLERLLQDAVHNSESLDRLRQEVGVPGPKEE